MSKYISGSKVGLSQSLFPENRNKPKKIIKIMETYGYFLNIKKHPKGRQMSWIVDDEDYDICLKIYLDLHENGLHPEIVWSKPIEME